jgi:hypothetical protein
LAAAELVHSVSLPLAVLPADSAVDRASFWSFDSFCDSLFSVLFARNFFFSSIRK